MSLGMIVVRFQQPTINQVSQAPLVVFGGGGGRATFPNKVGFPDSEAHGSPYLVFVSEDLTDATCKTKVT